MKQLRKVAPCYDCGGIVAPSAVSCPHCGSTEFRTLITDPIVEQAVRQALGMPEGYISSAHLKKVTELNLMGTQTTDERLKNVAKLKNLRRLFLLETQITDKGIKKLAKLKKLKWVSLEFDYLLPSTEAELKKALPNCMIEDVD